MSDPKFTSLETQLVRASLTTKSDGELAALLEKPIEDVVELIDQLTGGQAAARSEQIQKQKEAEHQKRSMQNARKELIQERQAKNEKKQKEKLALANHLEKRKKELGRLEANRRFETKEVDLAKLISVRIDHKTHVFVKPGTNIEKIKKQYHRKPILDGD
jgi:hypothetical protein